MCIKLVSWNVSYIWTTASFIASNNLRPAPLATSELFVWTPYDFILRPLRLTDSWIKSKGNNIFSTNTIFYLTQAILDKRVYIT